MIARREAILSSNRETARLYRRAYRYLAAAKLFLDEVEDYYRENRCLDTAGLDRLALQVIGEFLQGRSTKAVWNGGAPSFATAITPDGPISYLETIVDQGFQRYIISGDDGTGKNELIARIKDAAVMRSFFVEVYHCALDPDKIDHLIIPQLKTAVLNSVTPHILEPTGEDRVIETDAYVKKPGRRLEKERDLARKLYEHTFNAAVDYISRAREVHQELESYYIPNMRFGEINRLAETVLQKILAYRSSLSPPANN